MYLGADVDAFGTRLVQHVGKQPHLKLEAEDIHPGDMMLSALQNNLFHKQAGDGKIDRPHRHQSPGLFAVEGGKMLYLFCAVGIENQIEEGSFLLLQLLLLGFSRRLRLMPMKCCRSYLPRLRISKAR